MYMQMFRDAGPFGCFAMAERLAAERFRAPSGGPVFSLDHANTIEGIIDGRMRAKGDVRSRRTGSARAGGVDGWRHLDSSPVACFIEAAVGDVRAGWVRGGNDASHGRWINAGASGRMIKIAAA